MATRESTADLELVRVSIAGSVDDGKSTLLGRLLLESGQIYEDQYAALIRGSEHRGETSVNLAHVTDGLRAEREQNITIDVAFRYLTTATRRFIIADTPGHRQYTRNMVTGASTADAAVILVDVQNGVTDQTRRHLFICSILGIPQIAVVINKMDIVGYQEAPFAAVQADLRAAIGRLQMFPVTFIATSAVVGDNVIKRTTAMPWYTGPTVVEYMEGLSASTWLSPPELRIPIQCVVRPDRTFRGYAGRVVSGTVRLGDELLALPSKQHAAVAYLADLNGPVDEAGVGANVMIELDPQVDVSRGDVLVRPGNVPTATHAFEAIVCWMSEAPSVQGKQYVLRQTTREVSATLAKVMYRFDIATYHREESANLGPNDIGRVAIETGQPVFLDTYRHNRATGGFILVDSVTNDVVAAGMVTSVTRAEDSAPAGRSSAVVWLTGLSGAGKSTLADAVAERLRLHGMPVARLDGDDLRDGLNSDLGFSAPDRRENLRRAAHVATLFARAGNVTLCSFITPTEADRRMVREIVGAQYIEAYVSASLETCEARDVKGLYKRARAGQLANFTGIGSAFEAPQRAEITLDTEASSIDACAARLADFIVARMG
ncbi:MAG: adenylyl-sulfate kinase [Fimbriimonadaceae bacterium]